MQVLRKTKMKLKENVQVEKASSDRFVDEEFKNEAEDNTKQSQKEI
jgi:hypothetical protein